MKQKEYDRQVVNLDIEMGHKRQVINAEITEAQEQIEQIDIEMKKLQMKKNALCQKNRKRRETLGQISLEYSIKKAELLDQIEEE